MAGDAILARPFRDVVLTRETGPRWQIELACGAERVLCTNSDEHGFAWRGPALNADETWMLFAAAELERENATGFARLLARLPSIERRPLTWEPIVEGAGAARRVLWEGWEPGCGLSPWAAGGWPVGRVLGRLGAALVRWEGAA